MPAVGRYKGTFCTVGTKAGIDILPNTQKTVCPQSNFRMMTKADEIGTRWARKDETSNKEYVCLSIAAPELDRRNSMAILTRPKFR